MMKVYNAGPKDMVPDPQRRWSGGKQVLTFMDESKLSEHHQIFCSLKKSIEESIKMSFSN